jgi:hypothetical protein
LETLADLRRNTRPKRLSGEVDTAAGGAALGGDGAGRSATPWRGSGSPTAVKQAFVPACAASNASTCGTDVGRGISDSALVPGTIMRASRRS